MSFPAFAIFISVITYAQLILRAITFLVSSFLVNQNLSVGLLRFLLLSLRTLAGLALSLFIFSFDQNRVISFLAILILLWGGELEGHMRRRTTAAYSTSDQQHQKLFNLAIFMLTSCAILASGIEMFGGNPVPESLVLSLMRIEGNWLLLPLTALGIFLFFRSAWLVLKYYSTLTYLGLSYARGLRKKKMKHLF